MTTIRRFLQTSCLLMATGLFVYSRAQDTGMTRLAPSAYGASGKVVGQVLMHPQKANFLKTEAGNDILLGVAGAQVPLLTSNDDLILQLEFMLAPGSQARVQLPNGVAVLLADTWQALKLTAAVSGSVGGVAPLQNAQKAPGLWQKLRLQFRQARLGFPAQLEQMRLNGVLVQENILLPNAAGSNELKLIVEKGTVAFKNIDYQLLKEAKPLSLTGLSYQLYKDWSEKTEQLTPDKLIKRDTTSVLTQEWGIGMRSYSVVYEGKMNAQEQGLYIFEFAYMGHMTFEIDGKTLVTAQWNEFSQKPVVQTVALSKGEHRFRLHYHRTPWRPAALGVFVAIPGVRPYALHAQSSLPDPKPIPTIAVAPNATTPEMVRSFVQLENEKTKRTHVLSVGTPQGWHYSLDLNRASLLQFWKGQFADVTEMWHERGEPQLLKPLGLAIFTKGQADIATLTNAATTTWPDSVPDLDYRGYRIDPTGNPVVMYRCQNADLTDAILPNNNGLTRTLVLNSPTATPIYVRLATGNSINVLEKGLYEVNNQSYYVQTDPKSKPIVRSQNGQQELLMPLTTELRYSLIW
jgi:hypothetical protein